MQRRKETAIACRFRPHGASLTLPALHCHANHPLQEALQLVKDGAEASTTEHRLELHAYHALARAHINTEKLQVMRMHLQVSGSQGRGRRGAGHMLVVGLGGHSSLGLVRPLHVRVDLPECTQGCDAATGSGK